MTSVPHPSQTHLANTSAATDFASTAGNPEKSLPLSQPTAAQSNSYGKFNEEWEASQRGSSIIDGPMPRSDSVTSQGETLTPSRGATLKKKASLKRASSLKRNTSRRSSRAGSVRSLALQTSVDTDEAHSAFYSPVPTSGNPTEILANRFQAWRKVLKDLITYFREIQSSYDHRAKTLLKVSNVINNTAVPSVFLATGGIDDALQILRIHHKDAIAESNKAKDIENDVILALIGLRSDLNQKIKEIKSLSGDFKNSVDREIETTRKVVNNLQEALGQSDVDPAQQTGRQDPYLLKLAVDRQVEKQIDEENYLHQAYLNLEASGRELEAIVVGEIQKSYNAYAGILKREADISYSTIEELRTGPIAMPKDHEWNSFVAKDEHFVDPRVPVREPQNINYPGRDSELAQEVRAGLMERKSKYLKSYTAGWYVLSPTHLHEFRSADKTQAPIMSLFLPEQKLGSHSNMGASSNKFMLKGRQTGSMHRGHSWVFRCESYDTMLAWYEDIKALTEKSPQERNAFVRQHARSISGNSQRSNSRAGSISSDGIMDEDDDEPFSAGNSGIVAQAPKQDVLPRRPQPGGRFPSDLEINRDRGLQVPLSPSSGSSGFIDSQDRNAVAVASLPGNGIGQHYGEDNSPTHAALINQYAKEDGVNPYTSLPVSQASVEDSHVAKGTLAVGVGLGGATVGAFGYNAYKDSRDNKDVKNSKALNSQLENQAALEAATIAAPDMNEQVSEVRTVGEANPPSGSLNVGASTYDTISGTRDQDTPTDAGAGQSDRHPNSNSVLVGDLLGPSSDALQRPPLLAGENHLSVSSISQLHIPGEFPRGGSM